MPSLALLNAAPASARVRLPLVLALTALPFAAGTLILIFYGVNTLGTTLASRWTDRIDLPVFLLAWLATSGVSCLVPDPALRRVLEDVKSLSLGFLGACSAHLCFFTIKFWVLVGEPWTPAWILAPLFFALALVFSWSAQRRTDIERQVYAASTAIIVLVFTLEHAIRVSGHWRASFAALALIAAAALLRLKYPERGPAPARSALPASARSARGNPA